jgi:hypothetical protein
MRCKLLSAIADLIPSGLAAHKLMKSIANDGIVVQTIGGNGKGILLRINFT